MMIERKRVDNLKLAGLTEERQEVFAAAVAILLGLFTSLPEIGLAINYSGIHRHSAYILQHTDLPGFNQDDQALLAALVRFQRKGLKISDLPPLPNHDLQIVLRCIRILRLAVAAHHKRQNHLLPVWNVRAACDQLVVNLSASWCEENRLLMQNLKKEQRYCNGQGLPLLFQLT